MRSMATGLTILGWLLLLPASVAALLVNVLGPPQMAKCQAGDCDGIVGSALYGVSAVLPVGVVAAVTVIAVLERRRRHRWAPRHPWIGLGAQVMAVGVAALAVALS